MIQHPSQSRPWVTYLPIRDGVIPLVRGQLYDYLLASNGVFIHACTSLLEAVIPVVTTTGPSIRGLTPLHPLIQLHTPRLPLAYLARLIQDARQPCPTQGSLIEALYRVVWQKGHMRLLKPPQRATVGHVTTDGDGGPDVLLELHTHGSLPAFWSRTDDRDERGFRLYGVLGRLQDEHPQLQMRVGVYGHFYPVPPLAVFQDDPSGRYGLTSLVTLPDTPTVSPTAQVLCPS